MKMQALVHLKHEEYARLFLRKRSFGVYILPRIRTSFLRLTEKKLTGAVA